MVISTTFIPFLLIHYIFLKGGKILYIYTKKTMLILNMSFTKKIMEKKNNLQDIILVQMYEIIKIHMNF